MKCSLHINELLKIKVNMQKCICLLREHLDLSGNDTHHTHGDADVLIVETAIKAVEKSVLLCSRKICSSLQQTT